MKHNNITTAWYILYFTYGLFPIIVGLDKRFNLITYWPKFLNSYITQLLHIELSTFMIGLAILEVAVGMLVLVKPLLGGYAMIALLVTVIIELISLGIYVPKGYAYIIPQYDTALRATAMLMGAIVFVLLTKELQKSGQFKKNVPRTGT